MGRLDLPDAYRDEDYTWSPESPVDAPLTAGDELGDDRPATGLKPTCDCHGEPMGWAAASYLEARNG